MTAPAVLTWALAALMLAIAAYCAVRPLIARRLGRSTQPAVDLMHAVMGAAMVPMLVPALSPLRAGPWLAGWSAAFGLGMALFSSRMLRQRWARRSGASRESGRSAGRACPEDASACRPGVHVLSCGAMLYMLAAAPAVAGPAAPAAGRAWAGPTPFAIVLAAALAVSAVVATDRLALLAPGRRFAAGSQFAATAPSRGGAPAATAGRGPGRRPAAPPSARRATLCPRLASCCQIAMAVAMAYMLIQMS